MGNLRETEISISPLGNYGKLVRFPKISPTKMWGNFIIFCSARYKGLLLFVPNFNTKSDENGFIRQFYVLLLRYIMVGLQNVIFKE